MTIIYADKDTILTDSFTFIASKLGNRCTYDEKVYKDPAGRFILAINGTQYWNQNTGFLQDLELAIQEIKKSKENAIKVLSLAKWNINGFLMTKSQVYSFRSQTKRNLAETPLVFHVLTEPEVIGLNTELFMLLTLLFPVRKAFELTVENGSGNGGDIHTYNRKKLKGL